MNAVFMPTVYQIFAPALTIFSYIGRVFWSGTDAFSIPGGRKLWKKGKDGSCACGGRHGKDND